MAYLHTFGYRKCSEHVHWLREVTCETTQACISSFLKHQGDTFLSGEFGIWRSYFHSKAFLKVKFNVLKRFLNVICRNNEIRSDWFKNRKSLNYPTKEKIKKIKLSTLFDPTPTHTCKMPRWLIKPLLCVQKAFIPSHQLKWKFSGMCLNCLLLWFSCYFLSVAIWYSEHPHYLRAVESILFF